MPRVCVRLLLALALVVGAGGAASAAPAPPSPLVRVELLAETRAIAAGRPFWVALRQQITPGWHTYWMNPGDSGEPPTIEWALPDGFTAGPLQWPPPERIAVGPAMSYGYSREVVLPIVLTAPSGLAPGTPVSLRGRASWIVCEKTCVPEEAPVALTLPVSAGPPAPDPRGAPLIAAARRALPAPSPWPASFVATPERVTFTIATRDLVAERVAEAWLYPARWGVIEHAAPQRVRVDASGLTLEVARGPSPEAVTGPVEGVLVIGERLDGGVARQALSVRAEPRAAAGDGRALLTAALLALAGGLVLNLMPCVLPVLSVKALGLVHHAHSSRAALRWHGLAYTAGVLASFGLVAGTLIALRAGGEQLGWGFQLQSPVFVTLLAYVLFVMALALSGVIVVGARWTGRGHGLAARPGYAGSFFTGALATVAATPCTAPFMSAAIGYAVTQPWTRALLVFEALGLGLALPYLLLTLLPAWHRLLPAPGPWMARLERLLAVPLYASVAWLLWVVSRQAGPSGVAAALAGLGLIALALWLHRLARTGAARWRRATTVAVVALAIGAAGAPVLDALGGPRGGARASRADAGGEPFSAARLAELRAAGTPVFVNVTAAWCLTCLVNERVALRSSAVAAAFARKGVVTLKADWTSRDPAITRVLASFGRSGVPLYLLYRAGPTAEPTVLPQILSEGAVVEAAEQI